MNEPQTQPGQPVDPTNCEKEPIHVPGRVQPHGVLLVLKEPELRIVQLSGNTAEVLGRSPGELRGRGLDALLEPAQIEYLKDSLLCEKVSNTPLHLFTLQVEGRDTVFDGVAHCAHNVLVLELEPARPRQRGAADLQYLLRTVLPKLQGSRTLREFCETAARQVRQITGFDRVMVYRFDEHWNGSVLAEDKRDDLDSYLGLHYPRPDIPRQARELYLRNPLRLIGDVSARPVPVEPALNPVTGRPLDRTYAVLRGVSPVHIEYLKNMGVAASMSIAIVKGGALWGLIACHHQSARYVPYDVRAACELLGQVVSLQVAAKEEAEDYEYRWRSSRCRRASSRRCPPPRTSSGADRLPPEPAGLRPGGGAALCADGQCFLLGRTPTSRRSAGWSNLAGATQPRGGVPHRLLPGIYERAGASRTWQRAAGDPLSRVKKTTSAGSGPK